MKLKNLKIGTLLLVSSLLMILFVFLLGFISLKNSDLMHSQTKKMLEHPLVVQNTLTKITTEILFIRNRMLDMFPVADHEKIDTTLSQIGISENNLHRYLEILYDQYLGPRSDVDSLSNSIEVWNSVRVTTIQLIQENRYNEAHLRRINSGIAGRQVIKIMNNIKTIMDFADNKANSFVEESNRLNESLNQRLMLIILLLVLSTISIYFLMLRLIRQPLSELTGTALLFRDGNYNVRNQFQSKSEMGQLAAVFNSLADNIQHNLELNKMIQEISAEMISEDDARKFFSKMLKSLASLTGSPMAAVYLLSDDQQRYEHFESIGLSKNAVQSFEVNDFQGEFGAALASRKTQIIKNIPEDTRFAYLAVSGKFVPREIITIPLIAGNDILAVISLAGINPYSPLVLSFIEKIYVTLSTRVAGIMAYRKMKEFSVMLGQQNAELEAQKNELTTQSAELMQQNSELEQQKLQLDEANRLKTNFLSNMSHELRTPLNSVIALSGVLNRRLEGKIPPDEYSYIEVIERNGKHLLSLINDILDISRIEAGREEIEISRFEVNQLIAEVIGIIQPQASEKGLKITHDDAGSSLAITSDSGKITHILLNLIGNAVKFTEKGFVKVNAEQVGKLLKISVKDTGIGIEEENLSHIFDEFRQADGSTSRRFGGTGLGLAIAKKYANLLGGNITVKSTPGEGSEFVLVLPVKIAGGPQTASTTQDSLSRFSRIKMPEKPVSTAPAKSVLLVEDSEPAIIQMKDILEENNFRVIVATSGTEALEKLLNLIPDAIILDLMMPGIDGFEVLKNLRNMPQTAQTPVLILTAKHITKEDLKVLKGNDIFQLIQKGDVKRDELLQVVFAMTNPEKNEKPKENVGAYQHIQGKPVVLVVEDNPDNMLTVKAMLAPDYTIIEAVNGNEGVALARQFVPHLILMDIALPEMDGIQAFKIIRNDPYLQHIPIIALTASAMTSDREVILAHGFNAYIPKPIDEKEFFTILKKTLYGK